MKEIQLTQGKVALVDDEDFVLLSDRKWHASKNMKKTGWRWCAADGDARLMHRVIMVADDAVQVDHKNGDSLDNRRENLRVCTQSQNNMNQRKTRGSSKFKGVYWNRKLGKWAAMIRVDGRGRHLGLFLIEEEAAKVYDEMAIHFFGEFARLNFPVVSH